MPNITVHRPSRTGLYVPPIFSTSDALNASGGVGEQVFATTVSVPAGYFTANKALRIYCGIEIITVVTVPTFQLRMRVQKAGPTNVNLYAPIAAQPIATATTTSYALEYLIQGTAAAGAAVSVETMVIQSGLGGFTRNTIAQGVTVDTASAQTIQFTMQYGTATAGNITRIRQLLVEEFT